MKNLKRERESVVMVEWKRKRMKVTRNVQVYMISVSEQSLFFI